MDYEETVGFFADNYVDHPGSNDSGIYIYAGENYG